MADSIRSRPSGSVVLLVTSSRPRPALAAVKHAVPRARRGGRGEPARADGVGDGRRRDGARAPRRPRRRSARCSRCARSRCATSWRARCASRSSRPARSSRRARCSSRSTSRSRRPSCRRSEAQAALAETHARRACSALGESTRRVGDGASTARARERDVALAQIARTKAIIARKTIRAPFRARVGIADVHPGQYLNEGTELTTLQGVDDAAHVDFAVAQRVAAGLRDGDARRGLRRPATRRRSTAHDRRGRRARRPDDAQRHGARAASSTARDTPAPGASVRVAVPVGPPRTAVAVPVSALRKGPGGDHVFVHRRGRGRQDARARCGRSQRGALLGDEVVIDVGLEAGEQVAASGSFKLREAALVAVASDAAARRRSRREVERSGRSRPHALLHRHLHQAPGPRDRRQPRASCWSAGAR